MLMVARIQWKYSATSGLSDVTALFLFKPIGKDLSPSRLLMHRKSWTEQRRSHLTGLPRKLTLRKFIKSELKYQSKVTKSNSRTHAFSGSCFTRKGLCAHRPQSVGSIGCLTSRNKEKLRFYRGISFLVGLKK